MLSTITRCAASVLLTVETGTRNPACRGNRSSLADVWQNKLKVLTRRTATSGRNGCNVGLAYVTHSHPGVFYLVLAFARRGRQINSVARSLSLFELCSNTNDSPCPRSVKRGKKRKKFPRSDFVLRVSPFEMSPSLVAKAQTIK